MSNNDLKIGLAFSGGGYRASSFSLGVLTYLNNVKIGNSTLLEKIIVLSTVSGGTITGARYAIGIKNGETIYEIYKSLCSFMTTADLVNLSLDKLISKNDWASGRVESLINAFADIYDTKLFNKTKFGVLLNDDPPIHLKHIAFNATEFDHALQFRFQKTVKINHPKKDEPDRGIIGNFYCRIPEDMAKNIRMADILAASSCFPGGFEPINFPTDFGLPISEKLKQNSKDSSYPVGLMDGGIVDNQGIEPLLLAEKLFKKNNMDDGSTDPGHVLDLLIVSDVASPYMENYKASKQHKGNFWRNLTLKRIFIWNTIILILSLAALVLSIIYSKIFPSVISTVLVTINTIVFMAARMLRSIPKKFHVPQMFLKPMGKLLRIKMVIYENLILNRSDSLLKMTNDVFLKHVRKLNYSKIFDDPSWENRRIMNAIYELRPDEELLKEKIKEGKIKPLLIPSENIQLTAKKAASMGTTLWFSKEEMEKENMLNAIIATGQFNICWNLLEYIENLKKDFLNTTAGHMELIKCEKQLLEDWTKFQSDPLWLVNEYKAELKH